MADLKSKLRSEIARVEATLPQLKKAAEPVAPDDSIGRLSRMEAIGAQAINEKTYHQAERRLSHLKRALSHIDDEGFGLCSECEEPIGEARLLAVPESPLCIHCAEARE